ncbi:hypothetical protein [Streptomyces sp. NBC_00690]|uniref:hypothetical protein n=1 Tax=Streptomyces sp. NBC_00690 TaxID=2975808 RepID=UPI002E28CCF3|nr:hypothetical protein [Streptomyces sp. NBC_00690]
MTDEHLLTGSAVGEQIRALLDESVLPGANVLDVGRQLQGLSRRLSIGGPAELAVEAQRAAVTVLTRGQPEDAEHAAEAAGAVHTLAARLDANGQREEAIVQAQAAIPAWKSAGAYRGADVAAVAIQLTTLSKLLGHFGQLPDYVAAQKLAVEVLVNHDPPDALQAEVEALKGDMIITLAAHLRELSLPEPEVQRQVQEVLGRRGAEAAINAFYREQIGALVVGDSQGLAALGSDGNWRKPFTFGSIIKPLSGDPKIDTRYVVTIDTAAIKCFGTEDPSGEDEPYIVVIVYAVDPLQRERAVISKRIDFAEVQEGEVFGVGHQLAEGFFIPGDGRIRIRIALYDREAGASDHLEKKWSDNAKAGIIGGLAAFNPALGAAAYGIEEATGLVSDISSLLGDAMAEIFGDDKIDDCEFDLHPDFLQRLIANGSGLPRHSDSIPGIAYNFPELSEGGDIGGSWLFSGGGGSYRIFMSVRTAPITLTPSP